MSSLSKALENNAKYFVKTEKELREEAIKELENAGFDVKDGSVSKLFANIINKEIAEAYEKISTLHSDYFLSTASGEALDDKAYKKGLERIDDETDDSLRYRISIADRTNASCNFTAVRQTILNNFPNVYDVKKIDFTQGAGSCSLYIHSNTEGSRELENIKNAIAYVISGGVKVRVEYPKTTVLKLKIKIKSDVLSDSDMIDIRKSAMNSIQSLFLNANSDTIISHYDILNAVNSSSDDVKSCSILESTIDGEQVRLSQLIVSADKRISISADSEFIF